MSVLLRTIVGICIMFAALVLPVNGQACGKYYISVAVQDEAGKPIANADVRLSSITVDETRGKNFVRGTKDPFLYTIDYTEGYSFKEFHKLGVSAQGYKNTENKVKFLSCDSRKILVNLATTDSKTASVWHFENSVHVEAIGPDGKDVDGAKLIVINGKDREDIDMKFGNAFFDIKNGEYTFRIEAPGYETTEEKVDLRAFSTKLVKVELKSIRKAREVSTRSKYCLSVRDEMGASIPKANIKFSPTERSRSKIKYQFVADDEGSIDVEVIDGIYDISIQFMSFKKVILKNQLLPYDRRECITIILKSAIPPHQIT